MFTLNLFTPYSSILLVNPQPKREMNCASVLCSVFLFDKNTLANATNFGELSKLAIERGTSESKKGTLLTQQVVRAKTANLELARP